MFNIKKRSILAVLSCSLGIFNSGALFFGYPGILSPYWQNEFNATSAQTGLIMTFACLGVGLFMFISGSIHSKIGTRKCFFTGALILCLDMVMVSFANSIIYAYIWAFLCGVGNGFIYGPGVTTVQNWVPKRRGLVSGILNLAFGTSAAIMSPVYSALLSAVGYRTMNTIIIVMVVVMTCIALPFCDLPEFSNIPQDVKEKIISEKKAISRTLTVDHRSIPPKNAMRTKAFWMLWLCWMFMGAAGISMVSLSGKYAVSIGLASATVLTAFNLTNGISRFFAGMISDRIGRNLTCCIAFSAGAAGYLMIPRLSNIAAICIAAALVGFAFGTLFSVTAARISDLYGLKYYSMNLSLIFSGYGLVGGIVGPALSGAMLTGSGENYTLVFTVLAAFCVLSAIFVMQANIKTAKKRSAILPDNPILERPIA